MNTLISIDSWTEVVPSIGKATDPAPWRVCAYKQKLGLLEFWIALH